jgi:hypothetical protein
MRSKNGGSQKSTGDKTKTEVKSSKSQNKSVAKSKPKSTMQSTYDGIKYIMGKSIVGKGK